MTSSPGRIVITGLAINTALGDSLDQFYTSLIEGRSGVSHWKFFSRDDVYSKVGGDISDYSAVAKVDALKEELAPEMHTRMRKLCKKAPFSTKLSMLCAADAFLDAKLKGDDVDPTRCSVLVSGHNLSQGYIAKNQMIFAEEPDYIDSLAPVLMLDTDQVGSVSEVFGWKGPGYTLGGACASANIALRSAIDEIRYHDQDVVMVVGAPLDFSAMTLHAMALMGAISIESFNDQPERASRPYDVKREGFVPSHGVACLVVEKLDHALERGADIYAELLGCVATADACHLPSPSTEGQMRTIELLLRTCGVAPEEVDYVNAHATSTMLGDRSEIRAIEGAFGNHARKLKINATKSMLGHTCWSAPAVESVAGLLQMKHGRLHPSINIDELDPEVNLDVCMHGPQDYTIDVMLKNSFGFGGLNCCALYRRFDVNRS